MLKIDHISVSYGAVRALDDVSLHVEKDEIVALIGNNGTGKEMLANEDVLRAYLGL